MKKIKIFLIILVAICLLSIVLIKNNIIMFSKGYFDGIYYSSLEKVEVKSGRIQDAGRKQEKNWEEKVICERYNEITTFNNTVYYNCNSKPIEEWIIDEKIGEEYDHENKKIADIYSIKNISKDAAVALKFDGLTEYYAYINQQCSETTLEEFFNKYNIKIEELSFNSIDYTKIKGNKKFVLKTEKISEEVRKLVFNKLDVKLENYYEEIKVPLITIHTSNKIYGDGLVIYITENSKFILNIPAIRKYLAFDLEEDVLNKIVENLKQEKNNCLTVYFKKFELFGSSIIDS